MECQSPLTEVPDSPSLRYSVAKKEGRRIVGLLEELMSTPLTDTQQPSLVEFSLTNTPESTTAGDTLHPPRCRLFPSPMPPSQEDGAASCVCNTLDTTYPQPSSTSSGLTSMLTRAMEELNLSDGDIDVPEVCEAGCADLPPVSIGSANSTASSEADVKRGDSYVTGEANGMTPFASPFAALPTNKGAAPLQVKGPLISFSPAAPETARKPTCDRTVTIQSSSEGTLARLAVDDSSAALARDVVLNGCANSTVVLTTNSTTSTDEVSPAAATSLQPNSDFTTVAVDRCAPVVPELPHLSALCNVEDSLVTVGDDSFRTAYDDSPLPLCRKSFVVSRDKPLIASSDCPLASSQDVLPNAPEDSNPTTAAAEMTSDSPAVEVTTAAAETFACPDSLPSDSPSTEVAAAAETTFALPDSLPADSPSTEAAAEMFACPGSLRTDSLATEAAADTTFAVPDILPSHSPATETAAATAAETFAASRSLPSDSSTTGAAAAVEETFAPSAPPSKAAPRPPVPSTLQASSAADATTATAGQASVPGKPVSRPTKGIGLQTRKSLLPPPSTSQRPGRVSALVKPKAALGRPSAAPKMAEETFVPDKTVQLKLRAPLGRPGVTPKAAEETFATDKTAQPASAQRGAQQVKQEQGPARSRLSVLPPRRPLAAPPTRASTAAGSRQSMPAPGVVANGATKHTAGRVSAVTKTVTASTSSVPARTAMLPPPATTVAGARTATLGLPRASALTGPRGGSAKAPPRPSSQANGKPPAEPRQQTGLPRSRIAPPKTRVAGFSRLPTVVGSSASNRAAAPLAPVPESPVPKRLSSTPVRSDLSPLDAAACPDLTPIRRQ